MSHELNIRFVRAKSNAQIPTRADNDETNAGYDLYACESTTIRPFERKIIPIGLKIEIPEGYYGRIAPRSGLAVKKGIDVMAGVIDSGYRNEVGVVLVNFEVLGFLAHLFQLSKALAAFSQMFGLPGEFQINPGDRIAQIIFEKCHSASWQETDKLSESKRGLTGFGDSGK